MIVPTPALISLAQTAEVTVEMTCQYATGASSAIASPTARDVVRLMGSRGGGGTGVEACRGLQRF